MINKIAHTGDVHLRKLPTRNEEYEYVFNNLYKSLRSNKPDRIVIVGDLVHNYIDLGTEQIVLAKKFLNELAKIAPVRITRGNHDFRKKNANRKDAIAAIIETIDNENIIYYDKTGIFEDENILWAVWHHGDRNNNPWRTKKGREVLKGDVGDKITIDLFHDPVNGCKSVTGFEMKKKSYYKLKDFKGSFSLFADIHKQQFFDENKRAYCGSPISQDFSEGDDQFHGYLLWDLSNYLHDGSFDVQKIEIENKWSFKNLKLTPFTDFDDIDYEIDNPTDYMKIRIVWATLPSTRNKENERKIISYIKDKYQDSPISHKNEFIEEDSVETNENITVTNIQDQQVQHEIFKEYLEKIGVEDQMIDDLIKLDDEVTSQIEIDENTNIEWDIVKFGARNFMSYQEIDIDWRDMNGLFQIVGRNAAGKTTLFKILSYVLFSQTLETKSRKKFGDSRFVNNKTDDDFCSGYVVIEANGEYYGIRRETRIERKQDGEIKGASTNVYYYSLSSPDDNMNEENSIDSLTDDNKNKTQKRINEIIGSFENFNRVVLTTSDTLNKILSNDMAEFIDALLFDSGLDIFDKKQKVIKEHIKELNKKARINCDVEETKKENTNLEQVINTTNEEITEIEDVKLPEIKERIRKGEEYVETLTKKLYKIDDEIVNLDIESTNEDIETHENEIDRLNKRKSVLDESIKPLKESYDEEKLNSLINKRDSHREEINKIKLQIKEVEREKSNVDHKIEIVNGKIHVLKQNGSKIREEIQKLKNSKNCPTCGQVINDEEHKKHISDNVKSKESEMFKIADEIKEHNKVIDETHTPQIKEYEDKVISLNKEIDDKSLEMENVLDEIGTLTNEKNDVEKRNQLKSELDQIPIKIQNEELKKSILQNKLDNYNNSQKQIEENERINKGIKASKERLNQIREEETEQKENLLTKKNLVKENEVKIKNNLQLIKDFEEQEYQDRLNELYKKCVHRDGIPRQLLSNYIVPQINMELENTLSVAPFKVWLDINELRPQLAYYNTPDAVIDAISASGKERTFASVVLKLALNSINIKSKPTIFLLDEIMGKLNEESVEEFNNILSIMKEKYKKLSIIEHNFDVNPDYVISTEIDVNGISRAIIE